MTNDHWREVDELFRRALELSPAERRAYVARHTDGDLTLRRALEELLSASEEAGPFLEASIEDVCDVPWDEILTRPGALSGPEGAGVGGDGRSFDRSGQRVGPYRLVRRLGRGGMATVYLAERADGLWEQEVAVKILRRGLDTEDVIRRFLGERQILSSLDHPNIARLLDGGSTEDGLPYLVMEYVEGTPITSWCDERRLSVRERLALFRELGRAVQGAHRHLVVHRDLKPSNILVDAAGRVKLLDFGIAKILDSTVDEHLTRTALRPLTLPYASPEQVEGGAITTASDVYQLGLLLCELLSGRRPYEVKALSPARAERAITEADPAAPSTLVEAAAAETRGTTRGELTRRLRGDLDTIVLHALRKAPEERYVSPASLVEDIDRHRRGEPVSVRPDTVAYRTRKFVARHRTGVAATALIGLLLAAAVAMSLLQAERAGRERDRARAEAARAEQVTGYITELFQIADPAEGRGEAVTAPALLAAGVARAETELAGQPVAQAEVLGTIGQLYERLGLHGGARDVLERAVALRRDVGEPTRLVDDLLKLAGIVRSTDPDRAKELVEEAIALAEREFGPGDPRLAAALATLVEIPAPGDTALRRRAKAWADRAVDILLAYEGPRDVKRQLADALHASALGGTLEDLPRLREALRIRRLLDGEESSTVAVTLHDMGLLLEPYDPAAADTLLERAVEIQSRIHGPDHTRTINMLNSLAGRFRDKGQYERAEPLYREALRRRRVAYPEDSLGLAYPMHGLGWVLAELGRPDEAVSLLRDVIEILEARDVGPESVLHSVASNTLGRALAARGRYVEAEPLLRDTYVWMAANHPEDRLYLPVMRDRLVSLYEAWGRPGMAEKYRVHAEDLQAAEAEAP